MTGPDRTDTAAADPIAALQELTRDWITVWQSELTAVAVDREAQESWQSVISLWAGAAGALLTFVPPRGQGDARRPRAEAGAAAAPVAPDAGAAEVERLGQRIAELERRLADLERGGG